MLWDTQMSPLGLVMYSHLPRIHLGNAISFLTLEEKMMLTTVTLQDIVTSLVK